MGLFKKAATEAVTNVVEKKVDEDILPRVNRWIGLIPLAAFVLALVKGAPTDGGIHINNCVNCKIVIRK